MEIIKAKDCYLENGYAQYAEGRTVYSELNCLPETAELEYVESVSRWAGTGYTNSIYRIIGTDDAVEVQHNAGPVDNIAWERVYYLQGYFKTRQSYAQECGKLSRKYHIPFPVALAIGTEEEHYKLIAKIKENGIAEELRHELFCGISRRKAALYEVLGEDMYYELGVDEMGQKNSTRIAQYLGGLDEKYIL